MNTKFRAVLDFNELYVGVATFTGLDSTSVELSKGDWEALGRPVHIEVLITEHRDDRF